MSKFFTIKIKPTILASRQHTGAFAAHDVLFNWHAFKFPKQGGVRRGITTLIRGVDGADQTARAHGFYFAHPNLDGTAPSNLGTVNATANGTGYFNNLIGGHEMSSADKVNANLDVMAMYATGGGAGSDQIPFIHLHDKENVAGELDDGGHTTIYISAVGGASNTWDFSTGVVTSQAVDVSELSAAQLVNADIEGTDPRNVFAVGDIIYAEDDVIVGEIASIPDANTITFKADGSATESGTSYTVPADLAAWKIQNGAGAAGDLASGDELYNINPITIYLHCEM